MKKILFFLIFSLFVFSPYVLAEGTPTISCSTSIQKVKQNHFIDGLYKPFEYSPTNIGYISISYDELIKVEPSTVYTFGYVTNPISSSPQRTAIVEYDDNFAYITYQNLKSSASFRKSFTTSASTNYVTLHLYSISYTNANSESYYFYEGTPANPPSTPLVEYTQCSPPTPPTPTLDSTYSSFITLYINRFNYLADGFTTNPYLKAMIGIIFAWVVLELLLRIIHMKGGYKK